MATCSGNNLPVKLLWSSDGSFISALGQYSQSEFDIIVSAASFGFAGFNASATSGIYFEHLLHVRRSTDTSGEPFHADAAGLMNTKVPFGVTGTVPIPINVDCILHNVTVISNHNNAISPPSDWKIFLLRGDFLTPSAVFPFTFNATQYNHQVTTGFWSPSGALNLSAGEYYTLSAQGSTSTELYLRAAIGFLTR